MEKKSTGIISVEREPGDPYRDSGTDWKAVEALTNEEVEQAALSDPDSAPVPVYDTPGLIPGTNPKTARKVRHDPRGVRVELRHSGRNPARLGAMPEESRCHGARLSARDRTQSPSCGRVAAVRGMSRIRCGHYPRSQSFAFCTITSRPTSAMALVSGICLGQASTQFCA